MLGVVQLNIFKGGFKARIEVLITRKAFVLKKMSSQADGTLFSPNLKTVCFHGHEMGRQGADRFHERAANGEGHKGPPTTRAKACPMGKCVFLKRGASNRRGRCVAGYAPLRLDETWWRCRVLAPCQGHRQVGRDARAGRRSRRRFVSPACVQLPPLAAFD